MWKILCNSVIKLIKWWKVNTCLQGVHSLTHTQHETIHRAIIQGQNNYKQNVIGAQRGWGMGKST